MTSNQTRAKDLKKDKGITVKLSTGASRNMYFAEDEQYLILQFQKSTNQIEKNRLFNKIYPVFNKVAHNLIYKYKLQTDDTNFQDLKSDVVTHLYEKIGRYNEKKGTAFSFFSIIAFNFLLGKKQKLNKKKTINHEIDTIAMPNTLDYEIYNNTNSVSLTDTITKEKISIFITHLEDNITMYFAKEEDYLIADAVIKIIKNFNSIEFPINNKAIYFLIREQTNSKQPDVLRIVKRLRKIYKRVINEGLSDK
jgi:hypothetical protein